MNPAALLGTNGLLADRVRIAIMATLAASAEPVDFTTLLTSLDLTRGNLSTHLQKLEEGGLITVTKAFVDRKPRTTYGCTKRGRRDVEAYLAVIEQVLVEATKKKGGKAS
ncbi:MAG TPA: transcriptional regulator [Myxococcales bacterium]|nr:transcriptional regulator [Myxococcales bacterium]